MRSPPRQVPTLTEVVDVNAPGAPAETAAEAANPAIAPLPAPAQAPQRSFTAPAAGPVRKAGAEPELAVSSAEQLSQRVLDDLQRELDPLLQQRVSELLAPALTRATEAMAQQLREELAVAMREMVTHAVAQELARLRKA